MIKISLFNVALNKSKNLLSNSNALKAIKSRKETKGRRYKYKVLTPNTGTDYIIAFGSPLSAKNILSLILYTDYDNLQFLLSCSFRKKSVNETNKALKKRNSEFYWWTRTLEPTIHLFGTPLNLNESGSTPKTEIKIKALYHGVSYLYFSSFVARFSGIINEDYYNLSQSVALHQNKIINGSYKVYLYLIPL